MKPKANAAIQRAQKVKHVQGEGPNWVIIAGGALLSTLSIRLGCKLKQIFDTKQSKNFNNAKENGKYIAKRTPGACQLHSKLYCYTQDEDGCYHCLSGISDGALDIKRPPASPLSKDTDVSLPLVKIPAADSNKDGTGVMWASSPDRLELPQRPLHHSNSSDSPCVSESGSDIYSRREVIQKLRQQLKRRDEMIMEMQAQITDLQNSLSIQMTHSANLQSQLDYANRDLFDAEREIQRLRKAIADHCVAEAGTLEKPVTTRSWRSEAISGQVNGYPDSMGDVELHCVGGENVRDGGERVEMLKREVGELKEVIEGKDFLLQSYKEQKVELCSKMKELQLKLASQVPTIL
ncbi:uncharacterized protein LOC103715538 [Phoenix dactylifera]|uniref:Uncharacterized protein LOC103715538 n=1 Tax=Phoenix dactylifera TaxID=42345 RepID=A0A8B8ZZG2_PHODC|nr:uncharacterized protein LOC103715538 [Phoenix dactylifera]XP_008801450.2 uncharacterized protein LOC103715538 [Phoenix dactylifera]XP_008801458.2 uncharacterized protein LOC103715538 [Phoenix dactylifera]XP_017700188.2 uncharacterized protein LOC103715538 [Phoenix dactylifera]XP_038979715.1 uncharacterized protein LOC103715538 [Phoenix dactylifera]